MRYGLLDCAQDKARPAILCIAVATFVTSMLTPAFAADGEIPKAWYEPTFSDLVAIVGILVAGVTLWSAIFEARGARKWKRKEFVAAQMKEFFSDAAVKRAMTILDYHERTMDLTDDADRADLRDQNISQKSAAHALVPHTICQEQFTKVEIAIRDIFDEFLDHLDDFYPMIQTKLIFIDDIEPYLRYWLESIADTETFLDPLFRNSLWIYIDEYEFKGVQALCKRLNCPIIPSEEDKRKFAEDIRCGAWQADHD